LSANTTYYGWARAVDLSGNKSVIVASTPAFLKTDPGIDYYSFVAREKTTSVGGGNYAPQLISIHKLSWNLTPELSVSNLVRYRPFSTSLLSNVFDNLASTIINFNSNTYSVGDELLYFASPESVSTFTIVFHRPIYRPSFEIYQNAVLVC
jgi:hypothetical protein